jgi:hypothetical protein
MQGEVIIANHCSTRTGEIEAGNPTLRVFAPLRAPARFPKKHVRAKTQRFAKQDLAPKAQTDAQVPEHRRRQSGNNKPRHHRVRQGERKQIWGALIGCSPNPAGDEGNQGDPGIREVKQSEDNGNKQDAKPTTAESNHCSPIEEAL